MIKIHAEKLLQWKNAAVYDTNNVQKLLANNFNMELSEFSNYVNSCRIGTGGSEIRKYMSELSSEAKQTAA